jgi:hypothetical protein
MAVVDAVQVVVLNVPRKAAKQHANIQHRACYARHLACQVAQQ